MSEHKVYFAPMMANDLGLNFTDKRNRNPTWTDHEIIRFLEILQEEKVMTDLAANKNKQVMHYTIIMVLIYYIKYLIIKQYFFLRYSVT